MTVLAVTHPTLLDVTKRLDPSGRIDAIAEVLNTMKPMIQDAVVLEGNMATGNLLTVRTGLPAPTWRKLYGGVQPTKSTTAQVTDTCGMLENYAEVDKAQANLNGNTQEFMLSENRPHLEAMAQEIEATVIHGNESTEPEAFTGLTPRYNDQTAANGENIFVGDMTSAGTINRKSIWLVGWGPEGAFLFYPKGSKAGLSADYLGEVTVENANEYVGAGSHQGGRYQAYRTHYKWDVGFSLRDWRRCARYQFDANYVTADLSTGDDLHDYLLQMLDSIHNPEGVKLRIYTDKTTITMLRRQAKHLVASSTLTMDQLGGGPRVLHCNGVPILRCDALAAGGETAVIS
jgi:hypothetical protein